MVHRLAARAALARRVEAPLVSERLAFVRAGGVESGHRLPLPGTREALDVVAANVRAAYAGRLGCAGRGRNDESLS